MPPSFIAYPGRPPEVGREIEVAIEQLQQAHGQDKIQGWKENDICGRFLVDPILGHIRDAKLLVADVTKLNFNVAFEIGYAIGMQVRLLLVKNDLYKDDSALFAELGIFDTLGYEDYSSGHDLASSVSSHFEDISPHPLISRHKAGRPHIFLVEPPGKDTYDIALASAVKKSKVAFERYDPIEKGRLPARYAMDCVCAMDALVARLLPSSREDSLVHNIRVAFCAGVAQAVGREMLLLQDSEEPVPLDYRDLVQWAPDPNGVAPSVGELALRLWDFHQQSQSLEANAVSQSLLSRVDFGSPIAENEGRQLTEYYLQIAEFQRALRGEYQAITGRKGSGKTAFFLELRNSLRKNPNNIILDLQPEGYQLLKFRESTLATLAEGSKEHLITALWEYVLLLETAHRILRQDKGTHVNNHLLLEPYHALATFMARHEQSSGAIRTGDFAERLENVLNDIATRLPNMVQPGTVDATLSYPNVTELLHGCDIRQLTELVGNYLQHKESLWVLVDNLDKGWPATGIHADSLTLVRCLQDAIHKIGKAMGKREVSSSGILFLRSDVYQRLLLETPDKGKTLRASLDLSNQEVLQEILRRRIAFSLGQAPIELDDVWPKLCVSHISATGEESLQFLLDRSLMRPRSMIEMLRSCQSIAITLQHEKIEEGDLKDGIEAYSVELATNIGLEIRDVYPDAPEVLYELLGYPKRIRNSQVEEILGRHGISGDLCTEFFNLLLWYGVLGLVDSNGDAQYIYQHRYEIRRLKACQVHLAEDADGNLEINPAFWSALEIDEL